MNGGRTRALLPGIYASSSRLVCSLSLFPKSSSKGEKFDERKMPQNTVHFLQSSLCFGGKRDEIRSSKYLVNLEGGSSANEKLWPPLHSFSLSLCNGGGREGAVGQGRVFGRNSLEFFGAASEQGKEEARQLLPGKKTKAKIIKGRKILRRPMLSLIAGSRRIKHLRAKHFTPDIESNGAPSSSLRA